MQALGKICSSCSTSVKLHFLLWQPPCHFGSRTKSTTYRRHPDRSVVFLTSRLMTFASLRLCENVSRRDAKAPRKYMDVPGRRARVAGGFQEKCAENECYSAISDCTRSADAFIFCAFLLK